THCAASASPWRSQASSSPRSCRKNSKSAYPQSNNSNSSSSTTPAKTSHTRSIGAGQGAQLRPQLRDGQTGSQRRRVGPTIPSTVDLCSDLAERLWLEMQVTLDR